MLWVADMIWTVVKCQIAFEMQMLYPRAIFARATQQ